MAVVNIHGQPALDQRELTPRSDWFFGSPRLTSPKFWLTGIAFLPLYLAFNKLTEWYQFDGLGITLWSPDNGLCLLLLTEGAMFAPFVFLGRGLDGHLHHWRSPQSLRDGRGRTRVDRWLFGSCCRSAA